MPLRHSHMYDEVGQEGTISDGISGSHYSWNRYSAFQNTERVQPFCLPLPFFPWQALLLGTEGRVRHNRGTARPRAMPWPLLRGSRKRRNLSSLLFFLPYCIYYLSYPHPPRSSSWAFAHIFYCDPGMFLDTCISRASLQATTPRGIHRAVPVHREVPATALLRVVSYCCSYLYVPPLPPKVVPGVDATVNSRTHQLC